MNMMEFHGDFVEITCAIISLLLILLLYFYKNIFKSRDAAEPPGPWSWPMVGYYYRFKNIPAEIFFGDLAKQYGDIYQLRIGSRRILVINGFEANKEALCTKGEEFANRPPIFCMKYLKRQGGILFDDYNNQYKETKKIVVNALDGATNKHKSKKYSERILQDVIKQFIIDIKKNEQKSYDIAGQILEAVSFISVGQLFGRTTTFDNKQMELIKNCCTILLPHKLITQIPDFFPLTEFWFNNRDEHWKICFNQIKQLVENELIKHRKTPCKNSDPDITDNLLQSYLSDHRISGILTDLFISSICTINSAMLWWVKIMASNPNILTRAQTEIDHIIGNKVSIDLSDISKLPFLEACVLEVLRFKCILPLGILRHTDKEKHLRGYLIPKNTIIMCNLWSVNRDRRIWENPNEFDPSRFFVSETNQLDRSLIDKIYSFGDGIRSCPGGLLTKMILFLLGSNLLKNFNIKLEPDKTLNLNLTNNSKNLVSIPDPFNVIIESRVCPK